MSDPTKDDVSLLSPEYDELFAKAVEGFVARMRGEPAYLNEEYCLFYPSFGNPEKKRSDIIVYGQAPNTWEIKINLNKWDLVPVVLTRDARNFSLSISLFLSISFSIPLFFSLTLTLFLTISLSVSFTISFPYT